MGGFVLTQHLAALRHFASIPNHAYAEATYDLTDAGREALNAATHV